jgi:hypothetical protein
VRHFRLTDCVPRLLRLARTPILIALSGLHAIFSHAADVRILVQSSPLAGFQYHAGGEHWSQLAVGDTLQLVREPDNSHDPKAVRVEWRGKMLGYLPRKENRAVAAAMDEGERVDARISRLREHRNPWQRVVIEVFVVL